MSAPLVTPGLSFRGTGVGFALETSSRAHCHEGSTITRNLGVLLAVLLLGSGLIVLRYVGHDNEGFDPPAAGTQPEAAHIESHEPSGQKPEPAAEPEPRNIVDRRGVSAPDPRGQEPKLSEANETRPSETESHRIEDDAEDARPKARSQGVPGQESSDSDPTASGAHPLPAQEHGPPGGKRTFQEYPSLSASTGEQIGRLVLHAPEQMTAGTEVQAELFVESERELRAFRVAVSWPTDVLDLLSCEVHFADPNGNRITRILADMATVRRVPMRPGGFSYGRGSGFLPRESPPGLRPRRPGPPVGKGDQQWMCIGAITREVGNVQIEALSLKWTKPNERGIHVATLRFMVKSCQLSTFLFESHVMGSPGLGGPLHSWHHDPLFGQLIDSESANALRLAPEEGSPTHAEAPLTLPGPVSLVK